MPRILIHDLEVAPRRVRDDHCASQTAVKRGLVQHLAKLLDSVAMLPRIRNEAGGNRSSRGRTGLRIDDEFVADHELYQVQPGWSFGKSVNSVSTPTRAATTRRHVTELRRLGDKFPRGISS